MKIYKETFFHSLCHKCIIQIKAIFISNDNSITLYPKALKPCVLKLLTYTNKIILKSSPTLILLYMFLKIILHADFHCIRKLYMFSSITLADGVGLDLFTPRSVGSLRINLKSCSICVRSFCGIFVTTLCIA